jgi:hypothetical protein
MCVTEDAASRSSVGSGPRTRRAPKRAAVWCVLIAMGLSLTASVALASANEVTRTTYREQAEPICKVNTEANERILGGVRSEVRAGKLKPAAAQFAKAATELKKTIGQLRAVPRPPADTARLSRWLGKVSLEAGLFEQVAAKLRAGEKTEAQRVAVKLTSNAAKANNAVLAFEFEYCRFEPSRFT